MTARACASLGRGTSAEEVDSFSGPVVSAKALLALVGWRASRDGRDDPPASAVLVRPAFGAAGPPVQRGGARGDHAPGPPHPGARAGTPSLAPLQPRRLARAPALAFPGRPLA